MAKYLEDMGLDSGVHLPRGLTWAGEGEVSPGAGLLSINHHPYLLKCPITMEDGDRLSMVDFRHRRQYPTILE